MTAPIVVVSGLPRSGTSLAMSMLEAGGVEIVTDGIRGPDESNPKGYYECERVKTLASEPDKTWLEDARGKAIKIISFLLRELPDSNVYQVIFMHRDLSEVLVSQRQMLRARGAGDEIPDERLRKAYGDHLDTVRALLASRGCFSLLELTHADVVSRPLEQAERIAGFLERKLDVSRMAAAVDRDLYRSRR